MPDEFDYHRYLASREWAVRKKAVRERSKGMCERCLVNPMSSVHHLTYGHIGDEPLEDLQAVCVGCHAYLSARSDQDPRWEVETYLGALVLSQLNVSPEWLHRTLNEVGQRWEEHKDDIHSLLQFVLPVMRQATREGIPLAELIANLDPMASGVVHKVVLAEQREREEGA